MCSSTVQPVPQFTWPHEHFRAMSPGHVYDTAGRYAVDAQVLRSFTPAELDEDLFRPFHERLAHLENFPGTGKPLKYEGGYFYKNGEKLSANTVSEAQAVPAQDGAYFLYVGLNPQVFICHKLAMAHLQKEVLNNPRNFFESRPEDIMGTLLKTYEFAHRFLPEFERVTSIETCDLMRHLGLGVLEGRVDPIHAAAEVHQTLYGECEHLARLFSDLFLVIGGITPKVLPDARAYKIASEAGIYEIFLRDQLKPGEPTSLWPREHYRGIRKGFMCDRTGRYYFQCKGKLWQPAEVEFMAYDIHRHMQGLKQYANGATVEYRDGYYFIDKRQLKASEPIEAELREVVEGSGELVFFGIDPDVLKCYRAAQAYLEERMLRDPRTFFRKGRGEILDVIKHTHGIALEFDQEGRPGEFREEEAVSFLTNEEIHVFPPASEIEERMESICRIIEQLGDLVLSKNFDPIKAAATVGQMLSDTHPFQKGSGLLTRLFTAAFLIAGGRTPPLYPDHLAYVKAIESHKFEPYLRGLIENA